MQLKDLLRLAEYPKEELGIEIEMEGHNYLPSRDAVNPVWQRTVDGSLRGRDNAEYVLPKPLNKRAAFVAIDFLRDRLKEKASRINDTVRAGVHVHVNVLGATLREMWTFVTCYYVLEELLTDRFCGEGRSGNHFCLRAVESDVLPYLVGKTVNRQDLRLFQTDDIRYAALNYTSLHRHGSLEFRAMRTPTDLNKIKTWIDILLSIKENSKMFKSPKEVVEVFSMGGEVNFMRQLLGPLSKELGPEDADMTASLRRGVRIAQEIAYAKEEWNEQE